MLLDFFYRLKEHGLPVSIGEYLSMLDGLKSHVAGFSTEEFYYFSRLCLIKDEQYYDRFDQLFGDYIAGQESLFEAVLGDLPEEWLQARTRLSLTDEEMAEIEAMGGFEKLMETLKDRLEEQQDRHEGGNKWIGTAGRSPFGAYGFNPEGVRIGQKEGRQGKAAKVWDQRDYRNLDENRELGTRNLKLALRRLRKFARDGNPDQLDLDDTIFSTAKNAGLLDIKMIAEKRNAVKVLLFLDVGGSMDYHVQVSEELFSAASSEFKRLEYFYFHNFLYERVWKDNLRRHNQTTPTMELFRSYGNDYKVIIVGDATMSPYEIASPGGSVEHWNEESGAIWMQRLTRHFPSTVWLNPEPEAYWDRTPSIKMAKELLQHRMYPLTPAGITDAIESLTRAKPAPLV